MFEKQNLEAELVSALDNAALCRAKAEIHAAGSEIDQVWQHLFSLEALLWEATAKDNKEKLKEL